MIDQTYNICNICKERAVLAYQDINISRILRKRTIHPQQHSEQLSICIDSDIIYQIEWVNTHIGPTFMSCQGTEQDRAYIMMSSDEGYDSLVYYLNSNNIYFKRNIYRGISFINGIPFFSELNNILL